jgi:hypothetical protein
MGILAFISESILYSIYTIISMSDKYYCGHLGDLPSLQAAKF